MEHRKVGDTVGDLEGDVNVLFDAEDPTLRLSAAAVRDSLILLYGEDRTAPVDPIEAASFRLKIAETAKDGPAHLQEDIE